MTDTQRVKELRAMPKGKLIGRIVALEAQVRRLQDDVERIGRERDDMIRANAQLQEAK